MEQYSFTTTPPFVCPFGGPRSAWLSVKVGEGGNLAELLRRAIAATPDYNTIYAVVPPSEIAVYCEVGFQLVGAPTRNMCNGYKMFVMRRRDTASLSRVH